MMNRTSLAIACCHVCLGLALAQAAPAEPVAPAAKPAPVKKPDGEDDVGTFEDLLTPGAGK